LKNFFKPLPFLKLTTILDHHLRRSLARLGANRLDLVNNLNPLSHLAKHYVLAIKPRGVNSADEELRAVCVGTSIRHAENSPSFMLEGEILVLELVSVD